MAEELMRVSHLVKHFPGPGGSKVKVIEDINFNVYKGETLGIVGESGCGKSTTARLLLRMIEPTSGSIFFKGQDISKLNKSQVHALRSEMRVGYHCGTPCLLYQDARCPAYGQGSGAFGAGGTGRELCRPVSP